MQGDFFAANIPDSKSVLSAKSQKRAPTISENMEYMAIRRVPKIPGFNHKKFRKYLLVRQLEDNKRRTGSASDNIILCRCLDRAFAPNFSGKASSSLHLFVVLGEPGSPFGGWQLMQAKFIIDYRDIVVCRVKARWSWVSCKPEEILHLLSRSLID